MGRLSSISSFQDSQSLQDDLMRARRKIKDLNFALDNKCRDMDLVNTNYKN